MVIIRNKLYLIYNLKNLEIYKLSYQLHHNNLCVLDSNYGNNNFFIYLKKILHQIKMK